MAASRALPILAGFGAAALGAATTVPLLVAITDNVVTLACCEGRSMQPTINRRTGDVTVVLLDKWSVRSGAVARGDVVVVSSPINDGSLVLKRVLALGGDYVKRASGRDDPVLVPKGHCWIEGDNIKMSNDSNMFGPVPVAMVTAKVLFKIWPPSEMGALQRMEAPPTRVWRPGRDFMALQGSRQPE
ncbi:peptidase S24/S26A/S26B/S26C [Pavlovales sp. CCMP2436]|nr:peptidase S24/S26A/S26B/S26C [Pavlovales sp. CCMP2436]|mmetsp:Transcript_22177/g.56194  ORF Transcript_22177/g.56194 Transcript_22177/m.56194 type:complete len:187 (+) Transcript_22177:114-674(+)